MGFKDGTNNIRAENTDFMDHYVWVKERPDWMTDGTYLVGAQDPDAHRDLDRSPLQEQSRR